MARRTCLRCNEIIEAGNNFCKNCGAQVSEDIDNQAPGQFQYSQSPYIATKASNVQRKNRAIAIAIISIMVLVALIIVLVAVLSGGDDESGYGQEMTSSQTTNDRSSEAVKACKKDSSWSIVDGLTSTYGKPNITTGLRSGFTDVYWVNAEFPNGRMYEWVVDFREKPARVTYRGPVE